MFCREHVVQLRHEIGAIHAAGGELVVIGSGTPNFIAGFRETTKYDGPLYVDPQLVSYKAAGLKRGVLRTLNPLTIAMGVRAMAHGNFQGRTQGDNYQQGGILVIIPSSPAGPPGRIVYEHVSDVAGDNAPAREVVAALQAAIAKKAV